MEDAVSNRNAEAGIELNDPARLLEAVSDLFLEIR